MAIFEALGLGLLCCHFYIVWLEIRRLRDRAERAECSKINKERYEDLPETKATQKQIDEKEECSICCEVFQLEESVTQLKCEHIFHKNCIIQWLELSDTCPVCRKSQIEDSKTHDGQSGPEERTAMISYYPSTVVAYQLFHR